MTTIGIIAEYNPFHNGHLYHINKIKEMFPNSLIILILNGYFTQRGTLSILTKEEKTKIALENNIDLVIELPFIYGTQSSDIFAYNSIKLLNELQTEYLIFGSESNNIELLSKVADIQLNDPNYQEEVKNYLNEGLNYPTAMAKALNINEEINNPNDLLGISYIKAIKQLNSKIIPLTIQRTNDYHDTKSSSNIVSASNIRNKFNNNENIDEYLPQNTISKLININDDDIFDLLKFKILTDKDLSIYLDVDEGLEYRLLKFINQAQSLDEFIYLIKTKRYTYNKINRMLIHILIGLTKEDNKKSKVDYIKILGFNKNGQEYLRKIKKDITLPTTPLKDSIILKYELLASYVYMKLTKQETYNFDLKNIPIKKDSVWTEPQKLDSLLVRGL